MTQRIRIGLIGLSTTSKVTSWATKAHLPYLQSEQGLKHFQIVALCNTSKASGKKSIEEYKLDESVKTYDSPEDLAQDPDVDLVVNVTGVEQHYPAIIPSVKAGKNVFTELPLAQTMEQMQELVQTAREKKIKTVFGMQGQTSPVTKVVKDIITSGKIGKVLSATWTGTAGFLGEKPLPIGVSQFLARKVGANMMTVQFLHSSYLL